MSLALAEFLFAGPHLSMNDDRFDYGELRKVTFGLINVAFLSAFTSIGTATDG